MIYNKSDIKFIRSKRSFGGFTLFVNGYRFQSYPFSCRVDLIRCMSRWENGTPHEKLKERWPISKSKLRRLRKAFNSSFKKSALRGDTLSAYQKRNAQIKDRASRGHSYERIAARFKLTPDRVRQIVTDYKMPRGDRQI